MTDTEINNTQKQAWQEIFKDYFNCSQRNFQPLNNPLVFNRIK